MNLKDIHPETMKPHIGSQFQVKDLPGEPIFLKLTEVMERNITPQTESFSLFFHGPLEPFLPQGMRKLQHETVGELDLFLVPVGQDAQGFQYEAAFNHVL